MNPRYPSVAQRAEHRCEYCRAPEVVFNFPFEVDHVEPTSRGGSDDPSNLALACRSCNLNKAAHRDGVDPEGLEAVPLFRPRRDIWAEHFLPDAETGELLALTATGRATASRLRMNGEAQRAARRQWMRLGLFL